MRPIAILLATLLVSCGSKDSSPKFGQITRSDIIASKGEPEREEKIPVKDGSILIYGDETYQLENEVLKTFIRAPKGDEVNLLYWKHKFKDCRTKEEILPGTKSDVVPEAQLSCAETGESVIYAQGADFVRRIMSYEKK